MFNWNKKYRFVFDNLGAHDKVGVNDAGIGVFRKNPYIGLTKEILQNSTDAAISDLPDGVPVKVRFELVYIDREDIPDVDNLNEAIHECYEYYSTGDDGIKLKALRDAADRYLQPGRKVPVLKISDYNTTGLCGVREEKGSQWSGLVRERSSTNKTGSSSGSFGVGKFAPFNFSSLRTVFYSTKTIAGEIAFQGKALLTTFRRDNVLKSDIGLFAEDDGANYNAVLNVDDIAPVFRRDQVGTDIFVLGFDWEADWKEQSAISIIEYFFYAIYKGNLEVTVSDGKEEITISQENLGDMITEFGKYYEDNMGDDADFQYHAPTYWNLLHSPHKVIKNRFEYHDKDMGEYELYLLTGDDVEGRRVLEMREAGMKIREDTAFRGLANFTGIFIATGAGAETKDPEGNISSFLRKCESQAHDTWSANEYREKRDDAKNIIKKIHDIIRAAVKEEMPDFGKESTDAFGLKEFLQTDESDEDEKEEAAFSVFRPLLFEDSRNRSDKRQKQKNIDVKKNGGAKHKSKVETKNAESRKQERNNKHGNGTGKLYAVSISKVKTPFNDITGEYKISFTADETAENMILSIKLGSDDNRLDLAELSQATSDSMSLTIKNGMIYVGDVEEGEKKVIDIKLAESGRKALEVRAYAEA